MKRFVVIAAVLPALLGCMAAQNPRAQVSGAATGMNLTRMVGESENIVLARVMGVTSGPHPQFANLNTVLVALEVNEALKGSPGRELAFRQYVADIFDSRSTLGYRVGEEVVLFLRKPSEEGLTSPVGFEQGRFRVERDAAGNRVVRNGMDNAGLFDGMSTTSGGIRSLSPELQRLVSENRSGSIAYEQFKALVGDLVAAPGNAP